MDRILLYTCALLLSACDDARSPMGHTPREHREFWSSGVHRGHDMGHPHEQEEGHEFECIANGYLLEHCKE